MADECTDVSTFEQMSICLCFVDESHSCQAEVREEFIGFIQLENTDADSITKGILGFYRIVILTLVTFEARSIMVLQ